MRGPIYLRRSRQPGCAAARHRRPASMPSSYLAKSEQFTAEPSDAVIRRTVGSMIERPWCGPVLTAGGAAYGIAAASFARHLVFADHALSADILFSFRSDGLDPFGVMGRTLSADGAVGFGVHGGWHANEMSSVGILAGPLIEKRLRLASSLRHLRHCATVLGLLGLSRRATMTARALAEICETSSGRRGLRRRAEFEARLRRGTLKSGRLERQDLGCRRGDAAGVGASRVSTRLSISAEVAMQGKWPESVTCPSFRALWFSRRLAPAELEARTEKVLPFAARISPSDGTPTRWPLLAASRCSIRRASLVSTERGMGDCLSRY